MPAHDVVLLTGMPSTLAGSVCAEVLAQDERARVRAIVSAKSTAQVAEQLERLPVGHRERVSVVEGEAAALDYGLSGSEYKALARDTTRIHHCAHVTHSAADRKAAESANLGGAREAIEFARSCPHLGCLVMHSTVHVSGDRKGVVREEELKAGQSFRSVVEESRARAEKLARAEMGRLPVAIVRPATIVGDSRTGEIDRFDGPYLLVLLVVTAPPDFALPLPGGGGHPLNLVPVDWVAAASVAIGRDPRARGGTFHLVDPRPLTARRVFELVARAGGHRGPRGSIPANLARAVLHAPFMHRITRSPRALLETMTTSVTYDAANADALLSSLSVRPCPAFDSYVDKLVEYAREHLRQRRASRAGEPELVLEAEDSLG